MAELPHLIEVHPTRSVAIGILLNHEGTYPDVVLLIDLGYRAEDHAFARQQLLTLHGAGFSTVSGLEEVFHPVFNWSYRADLGRSPEDTHITVLADFKRHLVYDGLFISSPAWFAEEAQSQSAAVAVGNFSFLDDDPMSPGFFDGPFKVLLEAAMATSQVVGASIARVARRQ